MGVDFANWPVVPEEQRPLELFVNERVPVEQISALEALGWVVRDVRLLKGQDAVRATLQGLAVGSIRETTVNAKLLELAGKANQVFSTDPSAKKETKLLDDAETLQSLLSFSNRQRGSAPAALVPRAKGGRPKGSKDSAPRKIDPTKQKLQGAALKSKLRAQAKKAILSATESEGDKE